MGSRSKMACWPIRQLTPWPPYSASGGVDISPAPPRLERAFNVRFPVESGAVCPSSREDLGQPKGVAQARVPAPTSAGRAVDQAPRRAAILRPRAVAPQPIDGESIPIPVVIRQHPGPASRWQKLPPKPTLSVIQGPRGRRGFAHLIQATPVVPGEVLKLPPGLPAWRWGGPGPGTSGAGLKPGSPLWSLPSAPRWYPLANSQIFNTKPTIDR
jgi:hypothetical protein